MAPKISYNGKDKDVRDSKTKKPLDNIHKNLFIDLELELRHLENRSGKAFTVVGRKNTSEAFNERTGPNTVLVQLNYN